jgi:hypothetical protein
MGCWTLHKALDADEGVNNLFSVLFDSLTPARLALRANLRLLYLKSPAFSIVVNSAELGFDAQKNRPRSCDARAVGFSGNLTWFLRGRPGRLRGARRGRGTVSSSHS